MRYFLDIAYNGKPYHGFQRQPEDISVQEVLEDAIAVYFQKAVTILVQAEQIQVFMVNN